MDYHKHLTDRINQVLAEVEELIDQVREPEAVEAIFYCRQQARLDELDRDKFEAAVARIAREEAGVIGQA